MINNMGWILLYRKLLESEMWKALNSMQRDLLIACLLKANHKSAQWEFKKEVYSCEPGEFITSIENLRQLCAKGTTTKMVRTGLKKLQKWDFLASEGAKTGTKVCIVNWGVYQNIGKPEGVPSGKIGATSGQDEGKIGATNNNDLKIINNEEQGPHKIFEIDLETEFNKIYTLYPNKSSKSKAHKYFCSMELNREIIAKIHAVINFSKKSSNKWEHPKFIPYLINWLENKEYLDDITVSSTKTEPLPLVKGRLRIKCDTHGIVEVEAFKRGDKVVHKDDCPECAKKAAM